jgi:hypothetical protein
MSVDFNLLEAATSFGIGGRELECPRIVIAGHLDVERLAQRRRVAREHGRKPGQQSPQLRRMFQSKAAWLLALSFDFHRLAANGGVLAIRRRDPSIEAVRPAIAQIARHNQRGTQQLRETDFGERDRGRRGLGQPGDQSIRALISRAGAPRRQRREQRQNCQRQGRESN